MSCQRHSPISLHYSCDGMCNLPVTSSQVILAKHSEFTRHRFAPTLAVTLNRWLSNFPFALSWLTGVETGNVFSDIAPEYFQKNMPGFRYVTTPEQGAPQDFSTRGPLPFGRSFDIFMFNGPFGPDISRFLAPSSTPSGYQNWPVAPPINQPEVLSSTLGGGSIAESSRTGSRERIHVVAADVHPDTMVDFKSNYDSHNY